MKLWQRVSDTIWKITRIRIAIDRGRINFHGNNHTTIHGPKVSKVTLSVNPPSTGHRFIFYFADGSCWYLDFTFDRSTKVKREPKLFCVRCEQFVKKGESWSRKMWPDGLLRHSYNCLETSDPVGLNRITETVSDPEAENAVTPLEMERVDEEVSAAQEYASVRSLAAGAGE